MERADYYLINQHSGSLLLKTFVFVTLFLLAVLLGFKLWLQPKKVMFKSDVKLKGKIALITGANSGVGLETARDLARRGATVIIASRDKKKSEEAVKDIIASTGNSNVSYRALDLVKFSSIKKFVEDFNRSYDRLDILVNNAGCAGLRPVLSEDGIEKVTQINYIGPVLLTNLLLDMLIASKPSRIVVVSSQAHKYHDFDPNDIAAIKRKSATHMAMLRIYANSKLCNVLWTKALAKRLPAGVTVNALHPGLVLTNIFQRVPESVRKHILWIIRHFFKTSVEGAQTSIYLCVAPQLEAVSGEYFDECKIAKSDSLVADDAIVEKVWKDTMFLIEEKLRNL